MRIVLKKYFIGALSFFLVLSNFSFAATISICRMSMDTKSCSCSSDNGMSEEGPVLSKLKMPCCQETTSELSNTNVLTSLNNEILILLSSGPCSIDPFNAFSPSCGSDGHFSFAQLKFLIPASDIPIKISSLLI